jgi:hypothetical protein
MTHADAIDKISLRLNKLYSQDYNDLDTWKITEAVNKAVDHIVRRGLKGNNQRREGDEETSFTVDDYAILLKEVIKKPNKEDLFDTIGIPDDYRYFKRLTPIVSKNKCKNIRIKSFFIEEANIDNYLNDYNSRPSFDFEETFHTEFGKTFKVYHNKDFTIDSISLTYYRNPIFLDLEKDDKNTIWEFKEDLCEIIVDEAVKIIAGDTENINSHQIAEKNVENNF